MTVDRSVLDITPKRSRLVARMEVVGVPPLTRNEAGMKRPTYRAWLAALDEAAADAARQRPPTTSTSSARGWNYASTPPGTKGRTSTTTSSPSRTPWPTRHLRTPCPRAELNEG